MKGGIARLAGMIVACACVGVACGFAAALAGGGSVYQDLMTFREVAGPDVGEDPETWTWIGLVEEELGRTDADAPNAATASLLGYELGRLYQDVGRSADACSAFLRVARDELGDPNTRLLAIESAVLASYAVHADVDTALAVANEFAALVKNFQKAGVPYASGIDHRLFQITLSLAQAIEGEARREGAARARSGDRAGADAVRAFGWSQAARMFEAYAAQYVHDPAALSVGDETWFVDSMYHAARLYTEAGALHARLGDKPAGVQARLDAVSVLEAARRDHLRALLQAGRDHQFGALLVQNLIFVTPSFEEFVDEVRALAQGLTPGYELITLLQSLANDFSNHPDDPRKLAQANALFELVIEIERMWFPDEHDDHSLYQLSLLGSAQNYNRLNQLDKAAERIEELRELALEHEAHMQRLDAIENIYEEKRQRQIRRSALDDSQDEVIPEEDVAEEKIEALREAMTALTRTESGVREPSPEPRRSLPVADHGSTVLLDAGDGATDSSQILRWALYAAPAAILLIGLILWRRR
jgi:hypothetical protein